MEKEKSSREVPGWFKILILITALPVFAWPWLMNRATFVFVEKAAGDALPWALVMLLPLYVVLSTWISYRVYSTRPRDFVDFTRFANAGIFGLVCFDFLIRDYGLYRSGLEKLIMFITIS